MESIKLIFRLPAWQRQIIGQVLKEERKKEINHELIEKAKNACIKTQDEKFMFAFAFYTNNIQDRIGVVKELLKINPSKWAIPCATEITSNLTYSPIIDANLCVDALIKAGDCETLVKFAKRIGHNYKIENYLIERKEADLLLEYAEKIKGANIAKIKNFIEKYSETSTFGNAYKFKMERIYQKKIKNSKNLKQSMEIMEDENQK